MLKGLSARLLILTVIFVMLAEVLIYAPSISRFRKVYLEEMMAQAHLAALALEGAAERSVDAVQERELLTHAGAHAVVLIRQERRMLALNEDMPPPIDLMIDLRHQRWTDWMADAFDTMFQRRDRVLRVIGESPKDPGAVVEVIFDETPMREQMYAYSTRILQLSLLISFFSAGLLYLALQWLLVRPLRRITANMTNFQQDPEDEARIIAPSGRTDEIGVAERELAIMQRQVRAALDQKGRLAALGAAVAKVNHDLRNSLSTAMLASDRLTAVEDPEVQRLTPRLMAAIDKAVTMCGQTLDYTREGRRDLHPEREDLRGVLDGIEEDFILPAADAATGSVHWDNRVPGGIEVDLDVAQFTRAVVNLSRNAAEAGATTLVVTAETKGGRVAVDFADDGPGMPARALENLFVPFKGSGKRGGTGLGLVIARDIARAHGGELTLRATSETGTVFRLELPGSNIRVT